MKREMGVAYGQIVLNDVGCVKAGVFRPCYHHVNRCNLTVGVDDAVRRMRAYALYEKNGTF